MRAGALWAFFRKDLEDATRSHTLLLVLLAPVILSVFFVNSFGEKDFRPPKVALYAAEPSRLETALKARESLELEVVDSTESARQAVLERRACLALVVDKGFDKALEAGDYPVLTLVTDPAEVARVALAREALRSALRDMVYQEMPADIRIEKLGEVSEWGSGAGATMLPTWVVFTALSGLMVASSSMIEEKVSGTLPQVLTAPVTMVEVVVGKVGAGWLLASVSAVLVLILNRAPAGPGVLLLIAVGCLALSAVGVLIGLMTANLSAANAATSALFMLLFIPVALAEFSRVMARVAVLSPAYYLQQGVARGLVGQGVGYELVVLTSVAALIMVAATWWLRGHRI